MPSLRKLTSAEIAALDQRPPGARAQVAREYDAYLAGFAAGDYGRVDLAADERHTVVRGRLQAAGRRRGLALRFRPDPSSVLIFHAAAAPPLVSRPAPPPARISGAAERPGAMGRCLDRPAGARRLPSGVIGCCRTGCAPMRSQGHVTGASGAHGSGRRLKPGGSGWELDGMAVPRLSSTAPWHSAHWSSQVINDTKACSSTIPPAPPRCL